jgi:hypothetical protein
MARDKKSEIEARMAAIRAATSEEATPKANYLEYYKCTRQDIAETLSPGEITEYRTQASVETAHHKAHPTPEIMYE